MQTITWRRVGALSAVTGLLMAALAGPAQAEDTGNWWYTHLDVAAANRTSTGSGATVAVLDSGVQASLPAFGGRVLPGKSYVGGGDGRTDNPSRTTPTFGHGTAVAGYVAAARRNGIAGVAPGAKILPVTVGRSEVSESDAVTSGIVWAADNGAKVINISSAGSGSCTAQTQQAVDHALRKDVIIVAGTGNTPGVPVGTPANCVGVIAVGGMDYSGFRAWDGGTTGPQLDFVAPAENLSGLLLDGSESAPSGEGTSFATAMVSGTFALLRSKFPDESARQIVTRALWNVKNELGGKVFAKRINDQLGYGEILPKFALTEAPPAGATNPIYDEIQQHLGGSGGSGSSGGSSAPTSLSTSDDVLTPTNGPSPGANAADDSSGGISGPIVALIVVLAVAVVVLLIVLLSRSRRGARTAAGPPGGYGPPPGGYGPG